jgi:surface carbohydrate biosynthesis protein
MKKDEQLRADAIFCFSSAVGKMYSKYISSKIYPHGSLLNNKYPVDMSNKNNNEILYISQYRPPVIVEGVPGMPVGDRHINWDYFYSLESILLPRLNELCRLNGYTLSICGNSFNQEQEEEKFYKSFLGNNGWVYKEKTDNSSSYEKLDSPAIIASIDSTLGLEALGRGCKSMTFTGRGKITKTKDGNFGLLGNLSNQGYFWTSKVNIPEIDRVFYNVISCNDNLWQGFYKDIVPLVMEYDEGNSSLVHLIKKHLKD